MSKKISEMPNQVDLNLGDRLTIVRHDEELIRNREAAMGDMFESLDSVYVKGNALNRPLFESVYADIRFNRSIISLRFDDAKRADYDTVFPLLASRDLIGTFFVISNRVQTPGAEYATVAEALEMQEAGMEIACHTKTHGADPADYDEFYEEIIDSRDDLNDLGFHADSLGAPGSWFDTYRFDDIDMIHSKESRLIRSEYAAFFHYISFWDLYSHLHALPHRDRFGNRGTSGEGLSLANLQAQIDRTIQYGGGTQLYFHAENIGAGGYVSLADFTTFLDYVQTKRDAGLIDDLTVTGEVFAQKSPTKVNQIHDPDFELSVTGTWVGWEIAAGAPEVVGGGRSGNCASVDTTNYIRQFFVTANMRSVRLVAWAKSDDGTNVTAKIRVEDPDDATRLDVSATAVVAGAWTEIVLNFGIHYDTTRFQVILSRTDGDNDVLFDDIELYKV